MSFWGDGPLQKWIGYIFPEKKIEKNIKVASTDHTPTCVGFTARLYGEFNFCIC